MCPYTINLLKEFFERLKALVQEIYLNQLDESNNDLLHTVGWVWYYKDHITAVSSTSVT